MNILLMYISICIIHYTPYIYRPTRIRILYTSVTPTITLFDAPLHGRINPTESTWALIPTTYTTTATTCTTTTADADTGNGRKPENERRVSDTHTPNMQDNNYNNNSDNSKGYILFSLYKSYEYRDIWGTAFDRQYLQTLITEKGQNYDHDLEDDEEVINKFQ